MYRVIIMQNIYMIKPFPLYDGGDLVELCDAVIAMGTGARIID